ncbi:MAG: GAF domain-containing protein [Gammaproteobacteria bacterium]|nr:GAF domain-containing protein [Gammaproteobacteria bacterium]
MEASKVLQSVRKLTEVGLALSAERDSNRLMELILDSAKALTGADAGTLYSYDESDQNLRFEILLNDSLGIHFGGTSGRQVAMPTLSIYDEQGQPRRETVAAQAVLTRTTINIPDAYAALGYDFSGTRAFDERTGYRSISFLTVPMSNHEDEVLGVLQLINCLDEHGVPVRFSAADQQLVESLASMAAISLSNKRLLEDQARLFESFIELIAAAIDDKSPYTGGHCRRVPELTMMLADAVASTRDGPLAAFSMDEADRYELRIAAWLHDCGKVTTPEHVMDKSVKLETIFDRMHLVRTRFEVLKRDARIELLLELQQCAEPAQQALAQRRFAARIAQLEDDCRFLTRCNQGGEFMLEADKQRVARIADYRWLDEDGTSQPFLSDDEVVNLTIERGTLTEAERQTINYHMDATLNMLESLPYPKHLRRVPEFAGGHHEHMDGTGYPRGLTREQMSVQARVMAIADVFEALTAGDRPYKQALSLSQSLRILGDMCQKNRIDPDLFDVFVRERVYLSYANRFLDPAQIDTVDHASIPGFEERVSDNTSGMTMACQPVSGQSACRQTKE